MSATIKEIRIQPGGITEVFYWFTDDIGERQDAAMQIGDDTSALLASAQTQLDAAIANLKPQTTGPAHLVDALTQLGAAKTRIAQAEAQAAELEKQIAERQAALADAVPAAAETKPLGVT